jgi:hypothetical protein
MRRYPQDRELYPNEISRTEQTGYYLDRDSDGPSVCRYCRNPDTQQLVGYALKPFAEYYGWRRFKAYSCFCCGAVWSFACPTRIPNIERLVNGLYPFCVVVADQITVIRTPQAHHQWAFGAHNEFYSEAVAAANARSIAEGTRRSAEALQARHDSWAVARYLWWGSVEEPWYRERRGLPPTSSPLNSKMNPERVQCITVY